jgi:hypothetical protein
MMLTLIAIYLIGPYRVLGNLPPHGSALVALAVLLTAMCSLWSMRLAAIAHWRVRKLKGAP